jgi:hypothetical protein
MRPSLLKALWMLAGIGAAAAAVALLVGVVTEWGAVSGALEGGRSYDLWLVIEIALAAALVALVIATTKKAWPR